MTLSPASIWILKKYQALQQDLQQNLSTYQLAHSIESIYHFLWDNFANWYLEYLKTDSSQRPFAKELYQDFIQTLHPFLPFETEQIWQEILGKNQTLTLAVKTGFNYFDLLKNSEFQSKDQEFLQIVKLVNRIRSFRGVFGLDPAQKLELFATKNRVKTYQKFIELIAKTDLIFTQENLENLYQFKVDKQVFGIDLKKTIPNIPKEIQRSQKLISKLEKQINSLEKQLSNPNFLQNAEAEVVTQKQTDLKNRVQEKQEQDSKIEQLKILVKTI